jgi:hypothetical protein
VERIDELHDPRLTDGPRAEPAMRDKRPGDMPMRRLALLAAVLTLVAACGAATATPTPSGPIPPSPSGAPQPSPSAGDVESPNGAKEVVLQVEEGGGFVPVEWLATSAPVFTLYGDGTVIFRNPSDLAPESSDGLLRSTPFQIGTLTGAEMEKLLAFAINEGGLGVARDRYENNMIADGSTTTFTISAGGREKTVSIYGLGQDDGSGPNQAILRAFLALRERLYAFDGEGPATEVWDPEAYRGTLIESGGVAANVRDWPWPDIDVADFKKPAGPNELGFPRRAMSIEEIEALGITDPQGGVQGLMLEGPDGKTYSFAIRPLFPDETS